jgi:hypothetical protein
VNPLSAELASLKRIAKLIADGPRRSPRRAAQSSVVEAYDWTPPRGGSDPLQARPLPGRDLVGGRPAGLEMLEIVVDLARDRAEGEAVGN